MKKYKIKHKIVNCEKIESVTSHDLYPPPPPPVTNCHTFSDPLPPWSVAYFMDGPLIIDFGITLSACTPLETVVN